MMQSLRKRGPREGKVGRRVRRSKSLRRSSGARQKSIGRGWVRAFLLLHHIRLGLLMTYVILAEVLDLTHPENVALFRQWDQIEFAYIQMLRFIRITSVKPEVFVVSRTGKHLLLQNPSPAPADEDESMDDTEAPLLIGPPQRFSSTIMAMDEV